MKALEDAPAPAAAGASLLGDVDLAKHEPDLQLYNKHVPELTILAHVSAFQVDLNVSSLKLLGE